MAIVELPETAWLVQEYRRGRKEGKKEGKKEGRKEGARDGEVRILRRLIEGRFGPIPARMEEAMGKMTEIELESLGLRLLRSQSIDELLN